MEIKDASKRQIRNPRERPKTPKNGRWLALTASFLLPPKAVLFKIIYKIFKSIKIVKNMGDIPFWMFNDKPPRLRFYPSEF